MRITPPGEEEPARRRSGGSASWGPQGKEEATGKVDEDEEVSISVWAFESRPVAELCQRMILSSRRLAEVCPHVWHKLELFDPRQREWSEVMTVQRLKQPRGKALVVRIPPPGCAAVADACAEEERRQSVHVKTGEKRNKTGTPIPSQQGGQEKATTGDNSGSAIHQLVDNDWWLAQGWRRNYAPVLADLEWEDHKAGWRVAELPNGHELSRTIRQAFKQTAKQVHSTNVYLLQNEVWRGAFESMLTLMEGAPCADLDEITERQIRDRTHAQPSGSKDPYPGYEGFLASAHKSTGREHHARKEITLGDGRIVGLPAAAG